MIGSARVGGAETQMVRLACELRSRGEDVHMLFLAGGGSLTTKLDAAGVPWEVMRRHDGPSSGTLRDLQALARLAWRITRLRPSVVCAWLAGAIWPAMLFTQMFTRARRVAGFRGEVFDRDLRWQAPLFRHAISHAHVVTINSPSLRGEAERWGADPARVTFIPNGVDLPARTADVAGEIPTAVVVSNYRWYKGHDCLLQALSAVSTPVRVRLCGEGDGQVALRLKAQALGLSEVVTFVDEPADVPRELMAAQFAIHPSVTEGLSNAILEQLSHGLPVIACRVGGNPLLVEHERNGLLVEPDDSRAMASAIDTMAGDADLRKRMAVEALARVGHFTWQSCVDRYVELWDEQCGAGSP
ncbi:glycosyltransferase family 4 protein [Nocardioides sp.]|uniref:glycosyltransferase family 4 protein n=1 Tax=Nocardioides sp. TaxID=35761 RepID=UPI0035697815